MPTRLSLVSILAAVLCSTVFGADEQRLQDPDPAQGKKLKSGYTNCQLMPRAVEVGQAA